MCTIFASSGKPSTSTNSCSNKRVRAAASQNLGSQILHPHAQRGHPNRFTGSLAQAPILAIAPRTLPISACRPCLTSPSPAIPIAPSQSQQDPPHCLPQHLPVPLQQNLPYFPQSHSLEIHSSFPSFPEITTSKCNHKLSLAPHLISSRSLRI
ncbi:hypothetical protein KC19_6G139900 [Ceratodon purpureus]|uniref:Uncharacterized protein n=1 Tax=Ceratodon purpureus TaxID=3225 RepID=A0A8T0HHG2_CERPU|nr:hypothetical protein KC19_6G139900 [Ceratodon purpureus]